MNNQVVTNTNINDILIDNHDKIVPFIFVGTNDTIVANGIGDLPLKYSASINESYKNKEFKDAVLSQLTSNELIDFNDSNKEVLLNNMMTYLLNQLNLNVMNLISNTSVLNKFIYEFENSMNIALFGYTRLYGQEDSNINLLRRFILNLIQKSDLLNYCTLPNEDKEAVAQNVIAYAKVTWSLVTQVMCNITCGAIARVINTTDFERYLSSDEVILHLKEMGCDEPALFVENGGNINVYLKSYFSKETSLAVSNLFSYTIEPLVENAMVNIVFGNHRVFGDYYYYNFEAAAEQAKSKSQEKITNNPDIAKLFGLNFN